MREGKIWRRRMERGDRVKARDAESGVVCVDQWSDGDPKKTFSV